MSNWFWLLTVARLAALVVVVRTLVWVWSDSNTAMRVGFVVWGAFELYQNYMRYRVWKMFEDIRAAAIAEMIRQSQQAAPKDDKPSE